MLRTPPRVIPSYSRLPLPESPDGTPNQASHVDDKSNDDTPTPQRGGLPPSIDDLSNEDIMAQITLLKAILEDRLNGKRSNDSINETTTRDHTSEDEGSPSGTSPLNMDTSFDSTASLVSTVQRNLGKKRKGSSSPDASPARRLRVSAEIHASADDGPSGLTTPPPRQGPVRGKLFAPQHLGVSDEITVLHSRPATHPPSGTTNEQRRFPPNPSKPTSTTASSQSQSRQAQGQNAKDDQKTWH
ncbi:hypothetical protein QE152_g37219 [Popillia japonica]|uniref:Uncharacterized protein n=1 Tax=Popillia japonica TaxID=7064 RepID=A0AAW1IBH2_POPJA